MAGRAPRPARTLRRDSLGGRVEGPVGDSDEQLRDRMRRAIAQGGAAGAMQVLEEMGAAVEKEPEAGVGLRVRFGAGTDDSFTLTQFAAASDRPAGWPLAVPFLPDTAGALTLFDKPGHGFSIQWWKVTNPGAAVDGILRECVAAGWRLDDANEPQIRTPLPRMQIVSLRRDEDLRVITSAKVTEFGFVQLMERRRGERRSVPPETEPSP